LPFASSPGESASTPEIDVRAMPRVLRRIVGLAIEKPSRLVLAPACALGSVVFSLAKPRLLGASVDAYLPSLNLSAAYVR
jgi:hypothetical protein